MDTQHLTVMFTDIKGFTDRSSRQTREELAHLLELHDQLIRPIFKQFGGSIVKTIGDAFLVTFKSPTNAVLCGVAIQKTLRSHNTRTHPGEMLEIRVAINSGEVTLRDKDIYGEPVNIAARIEGLAEANEIYFTEAVYLAMNKSEIPTAEIGYRHLKGIPHQIKVYKVVQEHESRTVAPGSATPFIYASQNASGSTKRPWWKIVLIVLASVLLARPAILALADLGVFLRALFHGPGGLIGIALYVFFAYSLFKIAKRFGAPRKWMAFVPVLNLFYCITLAEQPDWWYLCFIVPGLNVVLFAITWMALARKLSSPGWMGILIFIPFFGMLLPWYLLRRTSPR